MNATRRRLSLALALTIFFTFALEAMQIVGRQKSSEPVANHFLRSIAKNVFHAEKPTRDERSCSRIVLLRRDRIDNHVIIQRELQHGLGIARVRRMC